MKVPLSWLREFVDITLPIPALRQRLTMAGLEVEEVHRIGSDWRAVTIGRVTDLQKHPRADTLHVATVDVGEQRATVVSAAPNLRVGALVPYVAPGGMLPTGAIGQRSFHGVTSEGMLLSADELGLSPDREGIYLLEDDAPPGQDLAEYLDETVLEIYITANRADCMSIVGIAREVHALTGAPLRLPAIQAPIGEAAASSLVSVRIEDPVGCPRFTAGVVQGVTIAPSPPWLQRRLYFAGVRPISNVVDVTNYVMLELGQPLHAFDRTRLHGNPPAIVVRRARSGERLITLDGQNRTLSEGMLVVADESGARSLAGIMGGLDSEIEDATSDVLLEGASWDRAAMRRTSSALNLTSEAVRRFGRGVDPELTAAAVSRAAQLTVRLAGGRAAHGLVDVYPGRAEPPSIRVQVDHINALLGTDFSEQQVTASLTGLDFDVARENGHLRVTVPSHRRFDVEHRADLAEEVARVVGYESIPATMPAGRLPEPRPDGDAGYADELKVRHTLAARGLQEVITYSLVEPSQPEKLDANASWPLADPAAANTLIRVENPQSAEHSALRGSLLGSLLDTLHLNLRHQDRVLLFEVARTWRGTVEVGTLPDERCLVSLAITGPRAPAHWSAASGPLDFFDLKGIVDALCTRFGIQPTYAATEHASLHPGRSACVATGGIRLGILGQLHPTVTERFDLAGHSVLVAELDFERLVAAGAPLLTVASPSRFPAAERDVAVVVDESTLHAAVEATIRDAAGPLLRAVRLFDLYRGTPIPEGSKSLAYALTYQAPDRTLSDEEVAAAHARVEADLRARLGAEIRGRDA